MGSEFGGVSLVRYPGVTWVGYHNHGNRICKMWCCRTLTMVYGRS